MHPQPKLVLLLLRKCCQQQPVGREAKRVQAAATERPRSRTHIMVGVAVTEEAGPGHGDTVSFLPPLRKQAWRAVPPTPFLDEAGPAEAPALRLEGL